MSKIWIKLAEELGKGYLEDGQNLTHKELYLEEISFEKKMILQVRKFIDKITMIDQIENVLPNNTSEKIYVDILNGTKVLY